MFSFATTAASVLALSSIVNASIANGLNLKILPLGASITWGQASSDGNGYRLQLRNLLEAQGHNVTYVGTVAHGSMSNNLCEAYPGSTISEVDAKATASGAYNFNPDVVLLHLGTNDCAAQRQPIDTAPQRFATLLSHLKSTSPNALILMSSLIHNKNPTTEACLTNLNVGLAGVANTAAAQGQNVQFVDMVDTVPWNDLSADGTHPTDAGYALMAQKWSDSILSAQMVTGAQKALDNSGQTTSLVPSGTTSTSTTTVAVTTPTTSTLSSSSTPSPSSAAPTTSTHSSSSTPPTSSTTQTTSTHSSSSIHSTSSAVPNVVAPQSSSSWSSKSTVKPATTSQVALPSATSSASTLLTSTKPSGLSSSTTMSTATTKHSSESTSPTSKASSKPSDSAPYPTGTSTGAMSKTGLPSSQLPSASAGPGHVQPYKSGSSAIFHERSAIWGTMFTFQLLLLAYIFVL